MVMWLSKISNGLRRIICPVAIVLNGGGVATMLILMFLIVASILLRYLFTSTALCAYIYEISEFMLVIVVFFGFGYTTLREGHVTVDILVSQLPDRARAAIDSVVYFISLVLFSVIVWRNIVAAKAIAVAGERSLMLSIPAYPFIYIVALGCAIGALLLLAFFLESLVNLFRK